MLEIERGLGNLSNQSRAHILNCRPALSSPVKFSSEQHVRPQLITRFPAKSLFKDQKLGETTVSALPIFSSNGFKLAECMQSPHTT